MKFKLLRVILFTLYFVSNRFVFSQSNEIQSNSNSISNYIRFENGKELSIEEFNTWYKEKTNYDENYSYLILKTEKDQLGYTHIRIQQTYLGYPIENNIYILHIQNNKIHSMNGTMHTNVPSNSIQIEHLKAFNYAIQAVNAKEYIWQNKNEEIHLRQITNNTQATYLPQEKIVILKNNEDQIVYCYKYLIYAKTPLSIETVYVNASNGKIEKRVNQMHCIHSKGKGHTVLSGEREIITDSSATKFTLKDDTRGQGIETYNLKKGTNVSNYVDFEDKNNIWDTINSELDQYAIDAHWGAEMTYDYYLNQHQRNSVDNQGKKLVNLIHYGTNFVNAFWDGNRMIFGDGDRNIGPLVSLDIIAHEITHGVTSNSAQLALENESGALNESFSDIFGVVIDHYTRPEKANWTVGEEVSSLIRSLENPSVNNDPDTYQGTNWKKLGDADMGGIHSNNGVQNHWFYLLSNGGNGTNDLGNTYQVNGIGIEKSAQIAYRNLTVYLTNLSDYKDAQFFSIRAAEDLFGSCSPEVIATTNAWHAVGIGEKYNDSIRAEFEASYSNKACDSITITFTNQSINASNFVWNFGDGVTSNDLHPSHTYDKPGNYSVQLIAKGGINCGKNDTLIKSNLIEVINKLTVESEKISLCKSDIFQVSSLSQEKIYWYSDSKSFVDTGVIAPIKTQDSILYYERNIFHVGEKKINTIGFYNFDVRYEVFDVLSPMVLKSVLVNANTSGNRTIVLKNRLNEIIQSKIINIPAGISRITLDFDISPGIDYRLGVSGSSIGLGRSSTGVTYPYEIKDLVSIKRSNADNQGYSFYYFFYDWEVKKKDCLQDFHKIQIDRKTLNKNITMTGVNLSADERFADYQWIDCDLNAPIINENNQNLSPTYTGNFAVILDSKLCQESDTSECISYINANLNTLDNVTKQNIYPNPVITHIHLTETNKYFTYSISNQVGQILQVGVMNSNEAINVEELSSGIYVIEIKGENLETYKFYKL
jgi:Zn-dependent metalloprotease